MKKYTYLIFLIFFALGTSYGQSEYEVAKIEKLMIDGYHAQFNPKGDKILYTSRNFKGLKLYDIDNGTIDKITSQKGAGYQPAISNDEIIFSSQENENQLERIDIRTKNLNVLDNGASAKIYMAKQRPERDRQYVAAKVSDDLRGIILISSTGQEKIISPIGSEDYISISLSPDHSKILFRASGRGSYVCDLNGKILRDFGDVEFPKWVNNDQVLFTKTEDDGYNYLSSDLFIGNLNDKTISSLTSNTESIVLYPDISRDEQKIVFNTPEGEVYMIHLQN